MGTGTSKQHDTQSQHDTPTDTDESLSSDNKRSMPEEVEDSRNKDNTFSIEKDGNANKPEAASGITAVDKYMIETKDSYDSTTNVHFTTAEDLAPSRSTTTVAGPTQEDIDHQSEDDSEIGHMDGSDLFGNKGPTPRLGPLWTAQRRVAELVYSNNPMDVSELPLLYKKKFGQKLKVKKYGYSDLRLFLASTSNIEIIEGPKPSTSFTLVPRGKPICTFNSTTKDSFSDDVEKTGPLSLQTVQQRVGNLLLSNRKAKPSQIASLYKEEYGERIRQKRFGYTSVKSFIADIPAPFRKNGHQIETICDADSSLTEDDKVSASQQFQETDSSFTEDMESATCQRFLAKAEHPWLSDAVELWVGRALKAIEKVNEGNDGPPLPIQNFDARLMSEAKKSKKLRPNDFPDAKKYVRLTMKGLRNDPRLLRVFGSNGSAYFSAAMASAGSSNEKALGVESLKAAGLADVADKLQTVQVRVAKLVASNRMAKTNRIPSLYKEKYREKIRHKWYGYKTFTDFMISIPMYVFEDTTPSNTSFSDEENYLSLECLDKTVELWIRRFRKKYGTDKNRDPAAHLRIEDFQIDVYEEARNSISEKQNADARAMEIITALTRDPRLVFETDSDGQYFWWLLSDEIDEHSSFERTDGDQANMRSASGSGVDLQSVVNSRSMSLPQRTAALDPRSNENVQFVANSRRNTLPHSVPIQDPRSGVNLQSWVNSRNMTLPQLTSALDPRSDGNMQFMANSRSNTLPQSVRVQDPRSGANLQSAMNSRNMISPQSTPAQDPTISSIATVDRRAPLDLSHPGESVATNKKGVVLGDNLAVRFQESVLLGQVRPQHGLSNMYEGPLYLNTHEPFCLTTLGVQGAGKSHTMGCILEGCLISSETVTELIKPMTTLVLHYDQNTASLCEAAGLLSSSQSSEPSRLNCCVPPSKAVILVSPTYYRQRKAFYGQACTVRPLLFKWKTLTADHIKRIMRIATNDNQLYVASCMDLLRRYQREAIVPMFGDFIEEIKQICSVQGQQGPLKQRIALLESIVAESDINKDIANESLDLMEACENDLHLIILDLTDPLLSKEEANGLFQVVTEQFRSISTQGGKLLALDEAHKFMDGIESDGLSEAIVNVARLMRHDGMRLIVSTQSPKALAPELLELVSVAVLHQFHSQDWWKYLKRKLPLSDSVWDQILTLRPGDAMVFASRSSIAGTQHPDQRSDEAHTSLTSSPLRVRIRPRLTADYGSSRTNH